MSTRKVAGNSRHAQDELRYSRREECARTWTDRSHLLFPSAHGAGGFIDLRWGCEAKARKGVIGETTHEGAADRRIGKSRASPRTQVARPRRHAGHPRCPRASLFERGSHVHRGVRPGPVEADGDISRLRRHRSHRRLARHPRGSGREGRLRFLRPQCARHLRGFFFEAAASAGIGKVIFISTTSVYRPDTRYGSSKILAELIAEDYRKQRLINVVTLRPRGFIPYWDRAVYAKYSDWARW